MRWLLDLTVVWGFLLFYLFCVSMILIDIESLQAVIASKSVLCAVVHELSNKIKLIFI